jgi:hypothetical protein
MYPTIVIGLIVWAAAVTSAGAQDAAQYREALQLIRDTAADICYTIEQKGEQSSTELSGEVDAKLGGVIARVADLGLKGAGELKTEEYQGVLREALAPALKHSADCKQNVFDKLVEKMLPNPMITSPAILKF